MSIELNIERSALNSRASQKSTGFFDIAMMVACLIMLPSAVLHGYLGIDERTAFALLIPLLLLGALLTNRLKVPRSILVVMVVIMNVAVIAGIVAGSTSQMLMGGVLVASIIVARVLFISLQKPKILKLASQFTLILLIGGVIGILYAFSGGSPLDEIQIGYRTTGLYLSTFSFATVGSLIRPSGIFDEPGAFAMFAAMITMFNDVWRQNHKLNMAILLLIVLTGSLAGVMLFILYFIAGNYTSSYRKNSLVLMALLAATFAVFHFLLPGNPLSAALDAFYSGRFEIIDGRLAGDNRTSQVEEFFAVVDRDILGRGAIVASRTFEHYDQSSNPFSITYGYGLIISIPYFALLFWLLWVTVKNRFHNSYASLGMLILLLQRPYIYNMMWSVMIASVFWLLYSISRGKNKSEQLPPRNSFT